MKEKPQKISLFSFLRPYMVLQALGLLLTIANNGGSVFLPILAARFVDNYVVDQTVDLSIIQNIVILVIASLVTALLGIYTNSIVTESIALDLRNAVIKKVTAESYSFLSEITPEKILTIITNDIGILKIVLGDGIASILRGLILIIGSIVLMFSIDTQLALYALLVVPVVAISFVLIFRRIMSIYGKYQKTLDKMNKVIDENIKGAILIRVFIGKLREIMKFRKQNKKLRDISLQITTLFAYLIPILGVVASLGSLMVIWFGGKEVIAGRISYGDFLAFNTYITFFIFPLAMIGFMLSGIGRAFATGKRVMDLLNYKSDFANGKTEISEIKKVEFNNVTVRDKDKKEALLSNINFEFKKGQMVGIVGSTGSGKTLIIQALLRFIETDKGKILLNNKDLRSYKIESVRMRIGFVEQDSLILNDTLAANILFGRKGFKEEDIERVSKMAEVHEFACKLKNKYQTLIGERGITLSGGQKQRISIARAILSQPDVLILDDSTSKLDIETEKRLLSNIRKGLPDTTVIQVAQKIVSIADADKIYVIDQGGVESAGDHLELKERSTVYKQILLSQSNLYEE